MKLNIENLGAVKKANIELGNLTVIAGENSTGKTYLVYTAWDILNNPQKYFSFSLKDGENHIIDTFINELLQSKKSTINLNDIIKNPQDDYSNIFHVDNHQSKKNLGYVFAKEIDNTFQLNIHDIKQSYLQKNCTETFEYKIENISSYVNVSVDWQKDFEFDANVEISLDINFNEKTLDCEVCIDIDHNSIKILTEFSNYPEDYKHNALTTFECIDILEYIDEEMFTEKVISIIMKAIIPERTATVISTSERAGIISFITDYLEKKIDDNNHPIYRTLTHTTPVQNNISLTNQLSRVISDRNKEAKINDDMNIASNTHLSHIYEEIEKMIGGTLIVEKSTGNIKFKPYAENKLVEFIEYHNLSSSIKSITMIYFQLKYSRYLSSHDILKEQVKKEGYTSNDKYYIIDEPEAFLHPANQVKMARIIAMMVNAGIKVLITTHSDYFIRELGALIAIGSLNVSKGNTNKLEQLDGYNKKMTLDINSKSVNVYGFNDKNNLEKQDVNKYGINLTTFDKAIDNQNKLFDLANDIVGEYNENMEE